MSSCSRSCPSWRKNAGRTYQYSSPRMRFEQVESIEGFKSASLVFDILLNVDRNTLGGRLR